MRILGIDPGSNITGYGVVQVLGNKPIHVDNGCIFAGRRYSDFVDKLFCIYSEINKVIDAYQPDCLAIENVFLGKNVASALKLGHVRGAIIVLARQRGLQVSEYTPTQVKLAVVGYGRAEKIQVNKMIQVILGLREAPYEDAADALAVGVCHANLFKTQLLQKAIRSGIQSINKIKRDQRGLRK